MPGSVCLAGRSERAIGILLLCSGFGAAGFGFGVEQRLAHALVLGDLVGREVRLVVPVRVVLVDLLEVVRLEGVDGDAPIVSSRLDW
ncbi:hypothetical protein [Streptomyces niveus]|uniref:hypothetical protein n=1 Tax=Streptomyces niveus TaxID=193462 RepID=UPI003418E940